MSKPLYFSAKSIGESKRGGRKPQSLLVAASHNLRDHQAEHGAHDNICLEQSHLNVILHDPSQSGAVDALARELKLKYAVPKRKLRKDHVQALEFVISVRRDSDVDEIAYFKASTRWLIEVFGEEMLLSAVVHYDEAEPYMHALVLPIMDGKYSGGAPIDMQNLPRLNRRFADEVGKLFGFSFELKAKLNSAQRTEAFNLVIEHLGTTDDPVLSSRIWCGVLEHIKSAPQGFIEMLGLQMPVQLRKSAKTSTQIFTSTGKKTSEDRERRRTVDLSCLGQCNYTAPFSTQEPVDEAA